MRGHQGRRPRTGGGIPASVPRLRSVGRRRLGGPHFGEHVELRVVEISRPRLRRERRSLRSLTQRGGRQPPGPKASRVWRRRRRRGGGFMRSESLVLPGTAGLGRAGSVQGLGCHARVGDAGAGCRRLCAEAWPFHFGAISEGAPSEPREAAGGCAAAEIPPFPVLPRCYQHLLAGYIAARAATARRRRRWLPAPTSLRLVLTERVALSVLGSLVFGFRVPSPPLSVFVQSRRT